MTLWKDITENQEEEREERGGRRRGRRRVYHVMDGNTIIYIPLPSKFIYKISVIPFIIPTGYTHETWKVHAKIHVDWIRTKIFGDRNEGICNIKNNNDAYIYIVLSSCQHYF